VRIVSHVIQKWCFECGEWQSLDAFFRDRRSNDGHTSYCKPRLTRRNAESKARRARGERLTTRRPRRTVQSVLTEKRCPRCEQTYPLDGFVINRSSSRGIGGDCLARHNTVVRENVEKNHGSTRNFHLRRRYDLTSYEVAKMVEEQGGKCAICQERAAEHVDHDHRTGIVRGILCFTCNVGLGNFRDDRDLLLKAHRYLSYRHPNGSVPVAPGVFQRMEWAS
jgi:hypothetical protein